MTIHLLKLCVGIASLEHLATVQLTRQRPYEGRMVASAYTRRMPRRPDEVTAGGSLYWIIKGVIRCRQPVLGFESDTAEDGQTFCRLLLDPTLVPTLPTPHRPFQGWRYFEPAAAPPDLAAMGEGAAEMPPEMLAELRALGLL